MSRELAIRVPSEIGAWVRQQSGSATETVLVLAKGVWNRRESIGVVDPGSGTDRLKIRLEPRALQFIRAATHSRDATAAVRKLLAWGYGRALPASPSHPRVLPIPRIVAPRVQTVPELLVEPQLESALPEMLPGASVASLPGWIADAPYSTYSSEISAIEARPVAGIETQDALPAFWWDIWKEPGAWILLLLAGYALWRWLSSQPVATATTASVGTANAAPRIAIWKPQVPTGLGAFFR